MPVFYFICGLLLLGIGIFATVAPEDYIYLQHFMRFDNIEPNAAYIKNTRIIGVIEIIIGIVFVIGAFFA